MNWVMKRPKSVEISRSDRELGSFVSVIDETWGINDRGAKV